MLQLVLLLAVSVGCLADGPYNQHSCLEDRTVIVHLFNWRWDDIADECERYLGPKGFCGVQVSPPNEHREIWEFGDERPWWERYQPVSYKLDTRSGNRAAFIDMVDRCLAQNVVIYVDAVINHMVGAGAVGTGSGGSSYDGNSLQFPGVPYGPNDFNCCQCGMCTTGSCNIESYQDVNQVRNCRLLGLTDLALGDDYVRGKLQDFMNDLIDIGVGGFRVDACKHMWPGDLQIVYDGMHDLRSDKWPANKRPFVFSEVIDQGGEPIKDEEYIHLGRVTEFKYCGHIANFFRGGQRLADIRSISNGKLGSVDALVFVDNHDNQRGHGGGGAILTFYESRAYKGASIMTMANNYGHVRIMSSYRWPGGPDENDGIGPPTNDGHDIKNVVIQENGGCDDGSQHTWVCEHRWRMIGNMAEWRNKAGNEDDNFHNWWDNGNNQVAFGRNGQAFIVFNFEDGGVLDLDLQTGLPAGEYCDIISGNFENGSCDGPTTITVDGSGTAHFFLPTGEDPIIAIHTGAMF